MTDGTARYARDGGTWFLKLAGDLRHPLGPALDALLDRAFTDPQFQRVVVDLCDAENIDSTCLGILARIANQARHAGGDRPAIIIGNEDIRTLLLAVCFDRLFTLVDTNGARVGELQPVPAQTADTDALLELILDAHRRLCAIDTRTHAAFRDLVDALQEEARQRQSH